MAVSHTVERRSVAQRLMLPMHNKKRTNDLRQREIFVRAIVALEVG